MTGYLRWRYATKKFDPSRKIPEREFSGLLESLRLAPSSYGLQPWKFVIVRDKALRKILREHAWDQPQVTDASHFIVLCALKTMDENYVKTFTAQIAQARGVARESLTDYEQMMLGPLKALSPAALSVWMKRQVYLALGMLLAQCAHKKIDSCPMEGFDAKKFDEILGLEKLNLESIVLCPIGYRAKDDQYAGLKKVRFTKSEVFIEK
jgi:nitroreductase